MITRSFSHPNGRFHPISYDAGNRQSTHPMGVSFDFAQDWQITVKTHRMRYLGKKKPPVRVFLSKTTLHRQGELIILEPYPLKNNLKPKSDL